VLSEGLEIDGIAVELPVVAVNPFKLDRHETPVIDNIDVLAPSCRIEDSDVFVIRGDIGWGLIDLLAFADANADPPTRDLRPHTGDELPLLVVDHGLPLTVDPDQGESRALDEGVEGCSVEVCPGVELEEEGVFLVS
jgi:hypothetical protein